MTIFSAPNYCGEFDNAGAMMSVDDSLTCSFQILKSSEKKGKVGIGFGNNTSRPGTPPHKVKKIGVIVIVALVCQNTCISMLAFGFIKILRGRSHDYQVNASRQG